MYLKKHDNIKSLLDKYWPLDKGLLKYHISNSGSIEDRIARTLKDFEVASPDIEIYEFPDNIGFFAKESDDYLTTIFVNPEFRNKKYMGFIWNTIKSKMNDTFYTALYSKNTKAINFFLRNGGKVIEKGFTPENNEYQLIEITGE